MRQWRSVVFFLMFTFACSSVTAWAFDFGVPLPEKPQGFVNDYANALTQADKQQLEQRLLQIQQKGLATITVLVVRNLNGHEIAEFAINVCDRWKVGKKGIDNGVLITIATEERGKNGKPGRRRIDVGRGLNGVLTDLMTGRILKASRETFDRGEMAASLNQATDSIENLLAKEQAAEAAAPQSAAAEREARRTASADASPVAGTVFTAMAALLLIALGGVFAVRRVQRNRERNATRQLRDELLKLYEEAFQETGKLACEAEKALLGLPELAKAKGEELLLRIRKKRDEISEAKGKITNEETSYWLLKQSAGAGTELKRTVDSCKQAVSQIEQLPVELEQRFVWAARKVQEREEEIKSAYELAASLLAEGYKVNTDPLALVQAEFNQAKGVLERKEEHPDAIVWKTLDERLATASGFIGEPKRNRESAAELIRSNSELFVDLSTRKGQFDCLLALLQHDNPAEVWQGLPQRFEAADKRFDGYIAANSAAMKANEIDSGVADFGKTLARSAQVELEAVKALFKEIEDLDRSLKKARAEYVSAFSEAERAYKQAESSVKETGVKPRTADMVRPLEAKLVKANLLAEEAKQGRTINLLALAALITEVSQGAKEVAKLAKEDVSAHRQYLRHQEELRRQHDEEVRQQNRQAVLAVAVDDDDCFSRSRGGGIAVPDSPPDPDTGGTFDGSGADD